MAPSKSATGYLDDKGDLAISFSSSNMQRRAARQAEQDRMNPGAASAAAGPSGSQRVQYEQYPDAVADVDDDDADDDELELSEAAADMNRRGKMTHRFGPYNVEKTLGEGSFGKVKLAVHRKTNQQVALKIIARKKLVSRDMAGRVEREIEYLTLLRHPHIIKLYNVVKTSSEIVMVLEYAGGELFDYIVTHGRMKEDEARRFFQQIIDAVEYCHRHKIVHRDLKPENLLLDDELNVKIADFGLSNIMTDGNFLKTSCGSPNYAAPEVIGGKLYAGPEVDVWSCGVILYVLLVGRLPFDDDHIPSLFTKISKGSYAMPNWMPPGPANLIKKMLVVNPVTRATIEDIRADPWFMTDLPAYLQPKEEDFINTGVDAARRGITVQDVMPNAPRQVQERLHAEVTEKISKAIGVGKADVQEALEASEPSAIKDAYLLVRENKMNEAVLSNLDTHSMSSGHETPAGPSGKASELATALKNLTVAGGASPLLESSARSVTSGTSGSSPRPYQTKVGILPTSLPTYHREYMERQKAGLDDEEHEVKLSDPTRPDSSMPEVPIQPRSREEQEETTRRLKPHLRGSQTSLASGSANGGGSGSGSGSGAGPSAAAGPSNSGSNVIISGATALSGLTPVQASGVKKSRPARWQFGIRSRNQPFEALLCIYKSLGKLGATWLLDEDFEVVYGPEGQNSEYADDNFFFRQHGHMPKHTMKELLKRYNLPADPWCIQVRWSYEDMIGSKAARPGYQGLRKSDLAVQDDKTRRMTRFTIMHMKIQLYEMDSATGVFLVDFMCDGYETADGLRLEEKDVTSPFPFLDMAARLIMQLAEAD